MPLLAESAEACQQNQSDTDDEGPSHDVADHGSTSSFSTIDPPWLTPNAADHLRVWGATQCQSGASCREAVPSMTGRWVAPRRPTPGQGVSPPENRERLVESCGGKPRASRVR